jgi:uncharacterized protein (DUF1800 family)
MGHSDDIALMAHLMRRAGFGATRDELETLVAAGYEETVEELIDPKKGQQADENILMRYYPSSLPSNALPDGKVRWMYHLLNTGRPLEEKMVLFWHCVFATGQAKVDGYTAMHHQMAMFRRNGMGSYRELLVNLAKDPAMLFWLDNIENHKGAVNENWGRELLELFSMGVDNYTEDDVIEASRAFTGWTIGLVPALAAGKGSNWFFEYLPEDHDDGEKTFLGHTGNFNGEDIIDIIVQQPATERFISRHLYNFFVADEPQVPSWTIEPPADPEAIEILSKALRESNFEMRPVLRTLFNSDFFKRARFAKVKSPAELVVGTYRLVGNQNFLKPRFGLRASLPGILGQDLQNPPSVEGWHTGQEWINSGSLMSRINFVADLISDTNLPGVQSIIDRVRSKGDQSPEELVDNCLDILGPMENLEPNTREDLLSSAREEGELCWGTESEAEISTQRIAALLQLVVSTKEYQFG